MTNSIDVLYFQELSKQDPGDVCRRALCKYDSVKKFYTLPVWGDEYIIYPHKSKVKHITKNVQNISDYFYLFIVHYLLKSKETNICEKWISEKDIPGGATFFRGPHTIPTHLISKNSVKEFKERCEQLHGTPISMADSAYSFKITPHIPVAVLYWEGDDEFSPESRILFDKSITEHLTPDIIFALSTEICMRLGGRHDTSTTKEGAAAL